MTVFHRRRFLHLAAGAAALPAAPCVARAQAYPTRAITMIVPFPPGGTADTVGRILADHMRGSLGQPVIIENVPGANGSIGVGRLARASSDGYTFGFGGWPTNVVNGAIYKLSYDLISDFQPIALLTTQPYLIISRKSIPADDLNGLIAWLKSNPDRASAATQGPGGASHVSGLLFQTLSGTRFQFVPYRGGSAAVQDLIAGQIDMMIASAGDAAEQVRAGTIKAHALTAESRLPAVPNVPTVDEAGLPGFYFSAWTALWAPARVSGEVIQRLNAAAANALADGTVRTRLAGVGQDVFPRDQQTPDVLRALQKAEIEKWWPIIKAANIKGE
jgi:tripartite-type tricarboxylate transporter receptor subunit TctC